MGKKIHFNKVLKSPANHTSLRIGIIDLIARGPNKLFYDKVRNPSYGTIMPQVVAAWAEQMGHKVHFVIYTGFGDLFRELSFDIDIVFISAHTHAAFLAYSISNIYRKKNIVTVLGGHQARSYAEDASKYFDYVIGFTDKKLIHDLLQGFSRHPSKGVVLNSQQHPSVLPGVRERWKFIKQILDKTNFVKIIPMLGSIGCPYKCDFCIEANVAYQPMPDDQIREDLIFLQTQFKNPIIAWHDPNFGFHFDNIMNTIESARRSGTMRFIAESSLSLLSEPHLKRLQQNNFFAMLPGIESWFDFSKKSRVGKKFGLNKVKTMAEHVNLIKHYIPYVQANFVFGMDSDYGPLPFELTKKFFDLVPGVFPSWTMWTAFGNSVPRYSEFEREGRLLHLPYNMLNGQGLNIKPKNYSLIEFHDYLIDQWQHIFSPRAMWRRFNANKQWSVRWLQLIRSISVEKSNLIRLKKTRSLLTTDPAFRDYYSGKSTVLPGYFNNIIKEQLGSFYDFLPSEVINSLERR